MLSANKSYKDYIKFLTVSMGELSDYRTKTGKGRNKALYNIKKALNDSDPFVVFNATLAATVVLADESIYH